MDLFAKIIKTKNFSITQVPMFKLQSKNFSRK